MKGFVGSMCVRFCLGDQLREREREKEREREREKREKREKEKERERLRGGERDRE